MHISYNSGDGAVASRAVVNSLLSMAGAALSVMLLAKLFPKHHWSCWSVNNASLAGLVCPIVFKFDSIVYPD